MKLNLFLSVVFIFSVLQLCKAGPLRLQKRAVFYIANETACVVDNLVYSNGDPIPTDDPCEFCKCRPPGFACVLKECKVKPGCKAVRRVGQCCPDYVCDFPETNQYPKGNALPPVHHLLPEVLPPVYSTSQKPETTEKPLDSTPNSKDETIVPVYEETTKTSDDPQTTDVVSEDAKPDPEIEDSSEEVVKLEDEDKKESLDGNETLKVSEEIETLFNSETEIKEKEIDAEKPEPTETEIIEKVKDEEPHTTVSNEPVEVENEKTTENVPITTKAPESEKQIKNSAADNGKSLKISDEKVEEPQEDEENKSNEGEEKVSVTVTESQTESTSEKHTEIPEESSTESKPEETKSEETQTSPPAVSFYSNDDKIKSESAETVTIVVHVREKTSTDPSADQSTEKDLITEKAITESETTSTQESLLKSHDELKSTEITEELPNDETVSTEKNFEVFASSTEQSKDEPTTDSPMTEQPGEKIEGRSEETDPSSAVVESTSNEEKAFILENDEDSKLITTTEYSDDKSQKVTTSEDVQEIKTNEPTVTIIKIDPNAALKIKILSDSGATILKIKEEMVTESVTKEEEEIKSQENSEKKDELKAEESIEEVNLEAREDELPLEEKVEETTLAKKDEETTPAKKDEETTSLATDIETTPSEKIEETTLEEHVKVSTSTEKLEEAQTEKVKESKSVDSVAETHKEPEKIPETTQEYKEVTEPKSTTEYRETTEQTTTTEHKESTEQATTTEVMKTKEHKHDESKVTENQGSEK